MCKMSAQPSVCRRNYTLARVPMLKCTREVNLTGLVSIFQIHCDWKDSPGILYERLEVSLDQLGSLAEPVDAATRRRLPTVSRGFLCDWAHKHTMESFEKFKLIETVGGYLGLAGVDGREDGDAYTAKLCLTPILQRQDGDHFQFVGPCHVLDLMEDEVTDPLTADRTKIESVEVHGGLVCGHYQKLENGNCKVDIED